MKSLLTPNYFLDYNSNKGDGASIIYQTDNFYLYIDAINGSSMNLQQLEYIIAVDDQRHFAKAAEKSFVTQPTLSAMISKLEEELDVTIFNRKKHPVEPTREGEEIIKRAREIVCEVGELKDYTLELKSKVQGELRLGVIPTLAPYLVPLFLKPLSAKYPELEINISEMITETIVAQLKQGDLDMGLAATPLDENELIEHHLFYEDFIIYAARSENIADNQYLQQSEINLNHLWLLQEGHCLRNQVFSLCELKENEQAAGNLRYEAGTIETLINIVDHHQGLTILPRLAEVNLRPSQKSKVRQFGPPKPVREISLVVRKSFPRRLLLEMVRNEIIANIPIKLLSRRDICQGPDPQNCEECSNKCLEQSMVDSIYPL